MFEKSGYLFHFVKVVSCHSIQTYSDIYKYITEKNWWQNGPNPWTME